MYGIAIMDSGNIALNFCRILEKKGYVFEVVSTPCQIAKSGCGYCLKFPFQFMDLIIQEGKNTNTKIREIYKVTKSGLKNKYEKVWIA